LIVSSRRSRRKRGLVRAWDRLGRHATGRVPRSHDRL